MKKQIEFRYTADQKVLDVVNFLKMTLNIRYHHHYIKGSGIGVLEYFEI